MIESIPILNSVVPSWTIYAFLAVTALLIIRRLGMPKPIAGIPYNPESARRILGDIPNIRGFAGRREFFAAQFAHFNSPIIQLFLVPFCPPFVLIADYREQVDVCLRRAKQFDRSWLAESAFGPIVPEHHIAMKSSDKRFKGNKALVRDLMTPGFLNEISAPQIYNKALNLISLWELKLRLSEGRPFHAGRDIWMAALDIIMGVAFGDDLECATKVALSDLSQPTSRMPPIPAGEDEMFTFPEKQLPEELEAFITVANSLGILFQSPFPRLSHWMFRLTKTWRKACAGREALTRREITKAVTRLEQAGDAAKPTNAMDYMLLREKARATAAAAAAATAKTTTNGRPVNGTLNTGPTKPNYFSSTIHDELFGYLVGGHDTSSTTLKWGLKHLTICQEAQTALRKSLQTAFPDAVARGCNPSVTEIVRTTLPVLDATIEETLRLARTLPVVVREALVDVELLGVMIPKGTQVFFNSHVASMVTPAMPIDESKRTEACRKAKSRRGVWDDESIGEFRPERWLKVGGDGKSVVYDSAAGPSLPFGSGPRGCFGRRLAYLELRILMALLVWNFEFLSLPGNLNTWAAEEHLTTQPKTCFVKIRKVV